MVEPLPLACPLITFKFNKVTTNVDLSICTYSTWRNQLSFPSGHAMGSMVFYFSVAFILCQFIRSNKLQIIVCLMASFMIVSIGMSRIYAGVHFPSDILGGYLLAFSWMALALAYYEKWSQWFQSKALQLLAK